MLQYQTYSQRPVIGKQYKWYMHPSFGEKVSFEGKRVAIVDAQPQRQALAKGFI
jgi:hypothetical protein